MAAGLSHWKFGRFDLYRVNPPLPRLVATLPVLAARPATDWNGYCSQPNRRSEFECGERFIFANGERAFWLFTLARWACIPFAVGGGYVCYRWSRSLYGEAGSLVTLVLWCFSPNILAHGQLITPDVPAAALGIAACYAFWRWLREPGWGRAIVSGLALGAAELAKMTFIIFYLTWPIIWVVSRAKAEKWPLAETARQALQLALIGTGSIYVINAGYAFERSFQPLGEFRFVSETLSGSRYHTPESAANRFIDSPLSRFLVPLPANYLSGVDLQKRDFEGHLNSYLRGQWRRGGWWYFYLYGLAIKVPLGTWALILLAFWVSIRSTSAGSARTETIALLLPAASILIFVSSQVGFTQHLRYVLPAFPFVFIWLGVVTRAAARAPSKRKSQFLSFARCLFVSLDRRAWLVAIVLSWSLISSLRYYPHSLSYFNELVGGPEGGRYHMLDSNLDWGQDLLYLRRWLDEHPEAYPLGLAYFGYFDPRVAGIDFGLPPLGMAENANLAHPEATSGPLPGWYAISASMLHGCRFVIPAPDGEKFYCDRPYFTYFQRFQPVAKAGYSIYIYHLDSTDIERVTSEQLKQLRKDRAMIARELPDLAAKHQRLCDAAEEPTHSGALRRAVHASKILLDDLAHRAGTDLEALDGFLTGQRTLTFDAIDRLTKILRLTLQPANDHTKSRRAKPG